MTLVKTLLAAHNITPIKARGQNFLVDGNILRKILSAAAVQPTDTVVEVGPGLGVLTRELVKQACAVIAVELDKGLANIIKEEFASQKNLTLIQDNALDVPLSAYGKSDGAYRVVANLPYRITSRFLRKFLEERPHPRDLVLLVQREVAGRIVARAPDMNLLALSVQYFATPKIEFRVSRNCFHPKPAVESACITIAVKKQAELLSPARQGRFFALIHAGFAQKRKKCASNLSKILMIPPERVLESFAKADIDLAVRAEAVTLAQWKALSTLL